MKLRSATSMTPFSIRCLMRKAGGDRPSRPFVADLCDWSRKEVAILRGTCEIAGSLGCSKLPLWQSAMVQLSSLLIAFLHIRTDTNNDLVHWTHGDGNISFIVDTCDLLSLIQLSHAQYEYAPDWSSLSFFAVTFPSKDSKQGGGIMDPCSNEKSHHVSKDLVEYRIPTYGI